MEVLKTRQAFSIAFKFIPGILCFVNVSSIIHHTPTWTEAGCKHWGKFQRIIFSWIHSSKTVIQVVWHLSSKKKNIYLLPEEVVTRQCLCEGGVRKDATWNIRFLLPPSLLTVRAHYIHKPLHLMECFIEITWSWHSLYVGTEVKWQWGYQQHFCIYILLQNIQSTAHILPRPVGLTAILQGRLAVLPP